jgi:hypothetical protein
MQASPAKNESKKNKKIAKKITKELIKIKLYFRFFIATALIIQYGSGKP